VGLPTFDRLARQPALIAHPGYIKINSGLRMKLDDGFAPPTQALQPRPPDVN
jgi:hypothetical protein